MNGGNQLICRKKVRPRNASLHGGGYRLLMKKHKYTLRIASKYALFQVPELLLFIAIWIIAGNWINVPPWLFWGSIALLIMKDVILFPFVWRAYDGRKATGTHALIGKRGTVIEPLNPAGYVRVNGEIWKAEIVGQGRVIEKGEFIRVEEVEGFHLIVDRIDLPLKNPRR